MRQTLPFLFVLCCPTILVAQGGKEPSKVPDPIRVIKLERKDRVIYEKEIEPIFDKKCTTCHSGREPESDFDLASYERLVKGGKRGPAVVPGNKEKSLVYKAAGRIAKPYMPPKREVPLSPEELAVIGLWIDQGAKAPTSVKVKPKIVVGLPPAGVRPVRAIAISPNKSFLAASRGNQIHLYETVKGNFLRSLFAPGLKLADGKAVKAAHVSLVASLAVSGDGKFIVSGSFQEIAIWDAKTGNHLRTIGGFAHEVVALAFSADSKLLATGGGAPTEEGEVKLFETASWKQIGEIKGGHSDTVYGLCFSPDGTKIVTCSADKFIKVWDVPIRAGNVSDVPQTAKFVKSFEGHAHHVLDVAWSPDGKLLASAGGDHVVKIWDYEKGEQLRTIKAHAKQVTRVLFLGKKNEILTCGGDAAVKIFNAANGNAVKTFTGATDFLYAVAASPDGTVIASGGQDGEVRLYVNGAFVRAVTPESPALPLEAKKKNEKKK